MHYGIYYQYLVDFANGWLYEVQGSKVHTPPAVS